MSHLNAAKVYVATCAREHAECASELVDALNNNAKVVGLGQRSVPLNDIDICCIAEAIRALDGECALRVLNLEENSFGLQGVQALMEAMEANPNRIRELRLGKNNLKDQAAVVIGHTLSRGGCGLKVLDLSENGITKIGVIPIAAALQNPTCDIVELSFHNNKIEGDAAAYLGEAICAASKLKHLHLGYNSLRDGGAVHLAKALPRSQALSTLDLTANRIGSEGGAELAKALVDPSCTLQRINLRHNQLDSETIERFAIVIEKNTSLIQLFLGFMNPTPEVAGAVLRSLNQNHTLLLLDIYGWKFNPKAMLDIVQGIQQGSGSIAAIVTDACQPIARRIDDGNVEREDRDLHPIYVGPDDRDAYLATKSLRRYSRAQSRRQSRISSSRARGDSQVHSAKRHSARRGEEADTASRASSRTHSRRGGRRLDEDDEQRPRSSRATSEERRPSSRGSSRRRRRERAQEGNEAGDSATPPLSTRSDNVEKNTQRKRRHHHEDINRPESGGNSSRQHHEQAQQLQVYDASVSKANREIEELLEEMHANSADKHAAEVVDSIVKVLQSQLNEERMQRQKENAMAKARIEALERRRECRCSYAVPEKGVHSSTTRQSPAATNGYNRQPNNNRNDISQFSSASHYNNDNNTNSAYPADRQDPYARTNSGMIGSSTSPYAGQPWQRPGSAYQRSVSRLSEYQDRCQTPLVHPLSEMKDMPPDLARSNDVPGEVKPEEAALQRSASVQNFPPRIEPSPSQDLNPPRRKSVSHAF